jgi:uncharacterized protein involved in propanediol utilization
MFQQRASRAAVKPIFSLVPALGPGYGLATAISHHGEILQGVFRGEDGRLRRGLVTLPRQDLRSYASFRLIDRAPLEVRPAWKRKARKAAELTLAALHIEGAGGVLTVTSGIAVGCGLGSSTSDVVAAIRATANAVGTNLPNDMVARISVAAEIASDSVMIEDQTVLFAQREGIVIQELGGPLPSLHVIGFQSLKDPAPVLTTELPLPDYSWQEIRLFQTLLKTLRCAVTEQAADLVGQVATESAIINERYLPVECFDLMLGLSSKCGSVGVQVAHSGTVAGLLFDSREPELAERLTLARRLLAEQGHPTWTFRTGRSVPGQ